ncbi:MAG: hypothetical protein LBC95_02775 [Candidatus Nomurabacteria bacterium]|jgi:hypothetical protein|nr:hypothetical protein [Candidatus Nomurabacteria bacterium]
MKKMRFTVICTALALIFAGAWAMNAQAEPTEKHQEVIRANCAAAQSDIQRISRNDVTARINRGRDYDQTLRLFYAMNMRLASNSQTVPRLAEITKDFEDTLSEFRSEYNGYNSGVKAVLDYGESCAQRPIDFYDSLGKMRAGRDKMHKLVVKLGRLIDDYKTVVGGLVK